MKNMLTIDVEDYFHVAALSSVISPEDWDNCAARVEQNTDAILQLLDDKGVKATFFVLGWVAERFGGLVSRIHSQGHEVACHGYSHQLVYEQSQTVFREETLRARQILEDITGAKVLGYRAASYSITRKSLWALDVLVEAGFEYDSSIFPVHHDRYGIPESPTEIHNLAAPGGGSIIEIPLTTLNLPGYRLPMAGGGYFRLYPYWFTRKALRHINDRLKQSFIFYLHPWEIDPGQPRYPARWLSRFRHYNNLDKCMRRFDMLVDEFEFTSVRDFLAEGEMDGETDLVRKKHDYAQAV